MSGTMHSDNPNDRFSNWTINWFDNKGNEFTGDVIVDNSTGKTFPEIDVDVEIGEPEIDTIEIVDIDAIADQILRDFLEDEKILQAEKLIYEPP